LRRLCPEIADISMPAEGAFHNCAIVSMHKRYPGQARKVMNFIWGMGQLAWTKLIVVVDADTDAADLRAVALRAFNNVDGRRDIVLNDGPLDALDHSSPLARYGTRVGVDATRKGADEGHTRPWPDALEMDADVVAAVTRRWGEYGI
jgi:4-hydroxy-3-polyprenylbenzoate decarboxylase